MRILVDHELVECQQGERVLVALLRAGLHPTGGGCLCLAGDCGHCLASVDGVGYVRTCQVAARDGMVVERHHAAGGQPPLIPTPPPAGSEKAGGARDRQSTDSRHLFCDVVIIGQGNAGRAEADQARAAGHEVITLDAQAGQEVVGIYHQGMVVARTASETWMVHPRREVVVATGAAEIQPVAPGVALAGLMTMRAAEVLQGAGIDLGRVVAVGTPPAGIEAVPATGELVRIEGDTTVKAVVMQAADGQEHRYPCDTACFGLGAHPRDALVRMGRDLPVPVRAVGGAARPADLPPCPRAGTVCACAGVTVSDLEQVWDHGFHELELVKRATLAGTGACQGSACLPHVRSFLAERGKVLQPPFTARPMTRQPTLCEIAAGTYHRATARTPLHDEHLGLGARMERAGGWWRPWSYGEEQDARAYRAVREAVSIGDVSTLGKLAVSGPDAEAFLDHLYPTRVSTLSPGRSRYALLLDERGYVLDDGLICRHSETAFTLTLTSAGATFGELWVRDWAEAQGADVRVMNQTHSLAAINLTGPRAGELLARTGVASLPAFARHGRGTVADIACRIYRLSFTGELSYELHCAAADAVTLWRRLLALGDDLGVMPHGLRSLLDLRLEKGHIVVGMDTDFDTTPRRIRHTWAVKLEKADFVGRQAVVRTNWVPLDRQLVGLEMASPAPIDGAVVWHEGEHAGYVTSSTDSPCLGKAVMLAWVNLSDGEIPAEVVIDDRVARRVPTPFYDPEGGRARVPIDLDAMPSRSRAWESESPATDTAGPLRRLEATRIVACPEVLDDAFASATEPASVSMSGRMLRVAPDEALCLGTLGREAIADPHAIVERESAFFGAWCEASEAHELLARHCAWPIPRARPVLAQGAVAEIAVKLWIEPDRVLFLVPAPFAVAFAERMGWSAGR